MGSLVSILSLNEWPLNKESSKKMVIKVNPVSVNFSVIFFFTKSRVAFHQHSTMSTFFKKVTKNLPLLQNNRISSTFNKDDFCGTTLTRVTE